MAMSEARLVVVFDVYGTLLDTASPVASLAHDIGSDAKRLADLWRALQLEQAWVCTMVGRDKSFREITRDALIEAMRVIGLKERGDLFARLIEASRRPDPWTDTRTTLEALRSADATLAVFSNGEEDMVVEALENADVLQFFQSVLSVEDEGVFKPDQRAYGVVLREFGFPAEDVAFVSSNWWDALGASTFGFRTFWIDRRGFGHSMIADSGVVPLSSLSDLADHLCGSARK